MQASIDNKEITIHNVDAQNVTLKCICPRCKSWSSLCLIDYGIFRGIIDCGYCADDGWDDCVMPVVEIKITQ